MLTEESDEKFMVLYMASKAELEKMMKNSTPEQQQKGMEAWMKWMNEHKPSLIDGGAPLGKTKRVDANGASNAKNQMGGYSVVQAETHDAATKMFGKERFKTGDAIEFVSTFHTHCRAYRVDWKGRFTLRE